MILSFFVVKIIIGVIKKRKVKIWVIINNKVVVNLLVSNVKILIYWKSKWRIKKGKNSIIDKICLKINIKFFFLFINR